MLALAVPIGSSESEDPWQFLPKRGPATDHSTFFKGPFKDGPSVTRACLECHPKAASDIMKTAHWNLVGDEVQVPGHDEPMRIGKRNLINNFCIGIKSNWPGCTSCHIGFGWKDDTFDLTDETLVDCLVCHEQTGTYHKDAGDAGLPAPDVDLLAAARSVGNPTRSNCGACHFTSGGGNAVKHGDLDETLLFPNPEIDVHMGKLGFQCVDCHQAEDHLPPGRLLTVSIDDKNRLHCTHCHQGDAIHADRRIDAHTDRVACQTCHIPLMAIKAGTKLSWDWSQAGQDLPITNEHLYLKIKGRFTWVKGAQPEYAWYNGTASRYLLGDKIDPEKVTEIAAPLGDRNDENAKLYPFKIHRGRQAYDTEHAHFILPHVYGDKGFWTQFDWDEALRIGSEATGLPFSGKYDFARTEMFMPQNHMVAPKEKALRCFDCHGSTGRMHWRRLGYESDPIDAPLFGRQAGTLLVGNEGDLEDDPIFRHEPIPMLDAEGEFVHESGNPLSTAMTCSQCHEIEDDDFLATHAYHSTVDDRQLQLSRRDLMLHGPRISDTDENQMNCFLCHLEQPNVLAWQEAKQAGEPDWAVSASLIGTKVTLKGGELLAHNEEGYQWDPDSLDEDELAVIPMARPGAENCGNCHGLVHKDHLPLALRLGSGELWQTETTGQVFSAQRIRQSALNIQGKDGLGRPWDVHAERLVECSECHYAKEPPAHLITEDPHAAEASELEGLRRCDACHTDGAGHDWLPEQAKHFEAVACEACHAPRLHLPARQQVDASVLTPEGDYLVSYRGLVYGEPDDLARAYVSGYRPALIQRMDADGKQRWAPMNLITRWYWTDGATGEEVDKARLRDAWFSGDEYRPEVMALFDANGNGQLDRTELKLDREPKVERIRTLLAEQGVAEPVLKAEVRAYHIHHNMTLGEANRDCVSCHKRKTRESFVLADYVPGDVLPSVFHGVPKSLKRQWQRQQDGSLTLPQSKPLSKITGVSKEDD